MFENNLETGDKCPDCEMGEMELETTSRGYYLNCPYCEFFAIRSNLESPGKEREFIEKADLTNNKDYL